MGAMMHGHVRHSLGILRQRPATAYTSDPAEVKPLATEDRRVTGATAEGLCIHGAAHVRVGQDTTTARRSADVTS